ncbi:MAG: hypothetical protein JWO95_503 [Verrucomicrobiales bacterium]|nr:hypothetical protein [Verrucomicrobiales bacterium]
MNHMKKTLLTVCAAAALLPFTGCLVAEGHGHGHAYGHARYETRTEVIVERPRPVIVVAPPRPAIVVRAPEIIIH